MKLLSLLVATGVTAGPLEEKFLSWMRTHGKTYSAQEKHTRFQIFLDNLEYIKEHNAKHAAGEVSFTLGLNKFADLTHDEYRVLYTSQVGYSNYVCPERYSVSGAALPDELDYRTSDPVLVTGIKDQGQCGSCWSFGSMGAWEGQLCKAGIFDCSTWIGGSEQELVDCSSEDNDDIGDYYNMGCNGGWADNAFYTLEKSTDGWADEDTYPYVSGKTRKAGTCETTEDKTQHTITEGLVKSCVTVPPYSDATLANALNDAGPVAIAIDASHRSFQLYQSGVYNELQCSSYRLDHAVLAVGFGTDGGDDYFLVKNSWGNGWGEAGFVKMTRGSNQCGVSTHPVYPSV